MILDDTGLPILDQFSEEGFVDCIFKISGLKCDAGFYHFNLLASHKGKKVGFAVKLLERIGPGFDAEMNLIQEHVYRRGVSFRSLGAVSDELVTALGELYGDTPGPRRMIPEESFTLIAVQQSNTDLKHHGVRMKLFGRDSEPFVEDDYYESFFNVDLGDGFVSWNEKDPDYRAPMLRALSVA